MTLVSLLDAVSNNDTDTNPISEEINTSWSLLILISVLITIILVSYFLQRQSIKFIHESVVSILLGIIVGIIIHTSSSDSIRKIIQFDHRYFFNLLLPPIILNSGYDLKMRNFFKNFGSILIFAFAGTFISTIFIGVIIFGFVSTGIGGLNWTFMECIIFGAILSSTDPVTVLAIFHQMKVDPKLYAIIFGESVLNDSVAIVLFSTLGKFKGRTVSFGTIIDGISSFVGVFTGSLLIGVILALFCALLFKYTQLYRYAVLESSLVALIAYASYVLSNALRLSGIVSLLFCAITLKHYAYDNMSIRSRRTTKYMFRVLSQLSENFVFIYLGVTLFLTKALTFHVGLIIFTLILVMVARYVSTIPLAELINYMSSRRALRSPRRATGFTSHPAQRHPQIPRNHQIMLWWAGLRGAIAFALSFEVEGSSGSSIRATILIVCVVSIILLGGTTPFAIKHLGIKTGARGSSSLRGRTSTRKLSKRFSQLNEEGIASALHASPETASIPMGRDETLEDLNQVHTELGDHLRFDDDDASFEHEEEDEDDEDEKADTSEEEGSVVPRLHRFTGARSSNYISNGVGRSSVASQFATAQINQGQSPSSQAAHVLGSMHSTDSQGTPETPLSQLAEESSRSWSLLAEEDVRHWFLSFDNRWLKPLFTHTSRDYIYSSTSAATRTSQFGRRSYTSPSRQSLLGSLGDPSRPLRNARGGSITTSRLNPSLSTQTPSSSRAFGRRNLSSESLAEEYSNAASHVAAPHPSNRSGSAALTLNSAFSVIRTFGNELQNQPQEHQGLDESTTRLANDIELWSGFMNATPNNENTQGGAAS